MLNQIVLMGRLTRDPELRKTQSGVSVASFTLAVDRDFGQRGEERQTDFIDIVAWRQTADFVSRYFAKGRMAVVSGRLQIRDWNDKDGNRRRSAEVVADNVYFGDSRRDGTGGQSFGDANQSYGGGQSYGQQYNRSSTADYQPGYGSSQDTGSAFSEFTEDDGDLPF